MTNFGIGFWLGIVVCAAVFYLGTHPDKRSALLSRVRALFHKNPPVPPAPPAAPPSGPVVV
jgi:hypothetical protein